MTREIPQDQWPQFFDDFSRQHQGWSVTAELLGADIGDERLALGLPLLGITADTKGSRAGTIDVIAGDQPDNNIEHVIENPSRVYLAADEAGALAALEITSADGPTTLLHFEPTDQVQ